jgi:hypothetical protein
VIFFIQNPEIIPIDEIDSAYGPLIPLCRELRTDVGRIDAAFINERGLLTLVECKLWKNPEARREVVAQTLDYVSALAGWSYSDLCEQVGNTEKRSGDVIFDIARNRSSKVLNERKFREAVSKSLREGRFLLLIVGDGFRASMHPLTELVNRQSTKAFSLGLIEIALYRFGKNQFGVFPRVFAKPEVIERHVTIVNVKDAPAIIEEESPGKSAGWKRDTKPNNKAHLKAWWEPVLQMELQDQEQEPPFWLATHNVVLNTPFPGIQIKALAIVGSSQIGVFLSGSRTENVVALRKYLKRERSVLSKQLPDGTDIRIDEKWPIMCLESEMESDDEKREWIIDTLNTFVSVLRPRLKMWYRESLR